MTTLGITLAVFVFADRANLGSHSGVGQSGKTATQVAAGAVEVHRAIRYDVSRPLASIHESEGASDSADCVGAGCGTSPGEFASDPDAQERKEEPIPPPTPAPTLTPEGTKVEQTTPGHASGRGVGG